MMKKIMLMAACALMAASVSAQNFSYGIKAGLNLATQTNVDELKMRPGIHAGVFGECTISDFVGIQGELLYSMMGARMKEDGITLTDKTDYIVLPILVKLYLSENLSLDLGPQFGYMVSARGKLSGNGVTASASYYDEVDKKFDVSAAMGLSYKIGFGLEVSARYNLGLTKLADGVDAKNSVIQIGLGYRFR